MASQLNRALVEVAGERQRQDEKWGPQVHAMRAATIARSKFVRLSEEAKDACAQIVANGGDVPWSAILWEEFCELFAEDDPDRQYAEAAQVAAVAVAIMEQIQQNVFDVRATETLEV